MIRFLSPALAAAFPLALLAALGAPAAMAAAVSADHVTVELVAERQALAVGENRLALRIEPEAGWHVYWRNPGDSGLPTRLAWPALPAGVSTGDLQWPYPHEHRLGDLVNYGYGENTLLPFTLTVAEGTRGPLALEARASWLVCSNVCIPGKADLRLSLPVEAAPAADPAQAEAFADALARVPATAPFAARFEIADNELRLAAGPLPGTAGAVSFYPYAESLIAYAEPARLARDGAEVRLARALSASFAAAPAQVGGVLVLGTGDTARAYEIQAQPGHVAAVPATAPPAAAGGGTLAGLGIALLLAFAGGLLLNLMPCVFPVLSLKALSVMQAREASPAHRRTHALVYTAGVLASFVGAAGLLLALRSGGAALGWGFQLQSPLFVGLLVYVMLAVGLSLSGLVQIGTRWMGAGQSLAARPGLAGSFFTGVLAVIVASPCTAPFMGPALGFALTQPAAGALAVFTALGLGLALPFLLLGFVPALARRLPRPGAWMETLKQALAFPLYLTAVWLLWVLGGLTDRNGMALALAGAVGLAFGLWLIGRGGALARLIGWAALAGAVALLFHPLLQPGPAATRATAGTDLPGREPYSDARFEELRAQKQTVFVDFTADWCLTCKVNERVALESETVQAAFALHGVVTLVADWTRADPAITATLARYGRSGVPLYLVSVQGGEPRVLPQILTPDLVAAAVAAP